MKFSTMIVVAAAAFCMAGCKYDKSAKDDAAANGAAADDMATSSEIATADANAGAGNEFPLSAATEGKFEDMYAPCTDVSFAPVYFQFDSTVVPTDEIGKIDAVSKHLTDKPERVVVIEGNCDERGSNEYNMSLGENRAIIVRNYLVQSGIDASRIQTRSYGEEKPSVDGHDESAWSQNRRAEFAIFDTTAKK